MQRQVRDALDRYFPLLLSIIVTIGLLAMVEPGGWGAVLLVAAQSFTAMLAVSTSDSHPKTRRLVSIACGVALVTVVAATVIDLPQLETFAYYILMLVLVAIIPVTIARRLSKHPKVTIQTVVGAICIYLLVGLFFVVAAGAIQRVTGTFFADIGLARPSDFVYWSFITLATVGYGDLVPGSDIARMVAILEALIGQIYLVTVVALLVSNISRSRRETE